MVRSWTIGDLGWVCRCTVLAAGLVLVPGMGLFAQERPPGKATLNPPAKENGRPVTPASGSNPAAAPKQRPQPPAPIDPALEKILQEWEVNTSTINTLQGKHDRFVYNKVFEEEKRCKGQFFYKAPDKGRIEFEPADINSKEVSRRLGEDGNPFRIRPGASEHWICNGQEIVQINNAEKSYEVATLPKEFQGKDIINSPLPFLFGMKAEMAKARYKLELKSTTAEHYTLEVVPNLASDAMDYKQATVRLNRKTMLPDAVKLVDPSGNQETVYVFKELEKNRTQRGFFTERDPFAFKPPTGYKPVVKPASDQQEIDAMTPNLPGGKTKLDPQVNPAGGSSKMNGNASGAGGNGSGKPLQRQADGAPSGERRPR